MSQPLIEAGKLIEHGYKTALATWRETLKFTIPLFLVPFILSFIAAPLLIMAALSKNMAYVGLGTVVYVIALVALVSWPTIKLIRFFLEKDLGHAVLSSEKEVNMTLILSYLWVSLLVGVAVGFGYILLIIPGIWLIGLLAFSQYCLLEDGVKGTEALKASAKLVKGRWWAVFGRLFLVGLAAVAVLLVASIAVGIVVGIIGSILGKGMLGSTLMSLINIVVQLIVSVLVTLYSLAISIKLFHALKHTPVEAPKA